MHTKQLYFFLIFSIASFLCIDQNIQAKSIDESTVFLSATPARVHPGGSATLSWNVFNGSNCIASGDWSGLKPNEGREIISNITNNAVYTFTCTSDQGDISYNTRVYVMSNSIVPYIEDGDMSYPSLLGGMPNIENFKAPRIAMAEGPVLSKGSQAYTKYDAIASHVWQKSQVAAVQALHPNLLYFYHVAPEEYQLNTMPFTSSGPATLLGPVSGTGVVYPGHWLYYTGTTLASPLNSSGTIAYVNNASRVTPGQYVVIYDTPFGSFNNAEFARVVSRNTSTTPHQVTLDTRGFKSNATSHATGSIMAEVKQGWDGADNPDHWSYNMSSVAPRDANGKQFTELEAEWIVNNMNKNQHGNVVSGLRVDGIYFDADPYFAESGDLDINNDGIADGGFDSEGNNLWGEGMESFYSYLSSLIPQKILIGGDRHSRGFALSGVQMESSPAWYGDSNPSYWRFESALSLYTYNGHQVRKGPLYTDIFNRLTTKLYPQKSLNVSHNKDFRMAFGFTLLGDGFYVHEDSNGTYDPWWDEFAVNVQKGSPTYGHAIASNPSNESLIKQHKGWLGGALGPRFRVVDSSNFALQNNLISNSDFETNTSGWTSVGGVTLSRETSTNKVYAGNASLGASGANTTNLSSARIVSPSFAVQAGQPYTVSFMIKAAEERDARVRIGWDGIYYDIRVAPVWRRITVTSYPETSENRSLMLEIGRENTEIWLDDVYVFRGEGGIHRRDYENGIVVVNSTNQSQTIDLNGSFQRILGTGQDSINDGSTLTQVTIDSYDSAILVRPENQSSPSPIPILHYAFDEGSGTTANDSSPNNLDGILQNSPTYTTQRSVGSHALSFTGENTGTNQHINIPHNDLLLPSSLSVSIWFKTGDTVGVDQVITRKATTTSYSYDMFITASDPKLRFRVRNDAGTTFSSATNTVLSPQTWYHAVGTLDASGNVKLYLNGVLQTQTASGASLAINNPAQLRIGATNATSHQFTGLIDDVRIYDQALESESITELFEMGSPLSPLSLTTPPTITNKNHSLLEIQTDQSGTLSFTGDCTFTPTTIPLGTTKLTLTNQERKTYTNCQIIFQPQEGTSQTLTLQTSPFLTKEI